MNAGLRGRLALRTRATRVVSLWGRFRGPGERTSAGDRHSYKKVCEEAARDPSRLASFKRHPDYTAVLEHVSCAQGREYLRIALAQSPEFQSLLDRFRGNDRLGEPMTCDYGAHGHFSPTTLRYVKVASDLAVHFGSLTGLRVIEIGGGYGGQCFITSVVSRPASYTLVDLEPCLRLQREYLSRLGVTGSNFVGSDELPEDTAYDLVISNYAFSECVRTVQEHYLTRVLKRARRGYVTCNWITPPQFRSLRPADLLAAIPGSRFLPEEPMTSAANRIWVWGPEREVGPVH